MSKDPAFPFYASDWLGSNMRAQMTLEQQGAYVNLLARQWSEATCSLPDDDKVLAKLSEMGEGWFNGGCQLVRDCFPPHPNQTGRIANPRLLELRAERDKWIEKSRLGGLKSVESKRLQRSKGGSTTVLTNGQPNANTPSPSPSPIDNSLGARTKPTRKYNYTDADLATAVWMADLNDKLGMGCTRPNNFAAWANEIRLTKEIDGRTDAAIRELYQWCHGDSFWKANVQSPQKLRKKWGQLQAKRTTDGKQPTPGHTHDPNRPVKAL